MNIEAPLRGASDGGGLRPLALRASLPREQRRYAAGITQNLSLLRTLTSTGATTGTARNNELRLARGGGGHNTGRADTPANALKRHANGRCVLEATSPPVDPPNPAAGPNRPTRGSLDFSAIVHGRISR